MQSGIKINVLRAPDEDELFLLEVFFSNGQSATSLEYWEYGNQFQQFGSELCDFPRSPTHRVSYELHAPNKGDFRWPYQMQLEVYCYDTAGHSAIKVMLDNRLEAPEHSRCEFYLLSDPGSINKLGQALKDWNPAASATFEWLAHE